MTAPPCRYVCPAEPYRENATSVACPPGALANKMLIRQHHFPDSYHPEELYLIQDHDYCVAVDYEHVSKCFLEFTGGGDRELEHWTRNIATDDMVFDFLITLLYGDECEIEWTGYRITGTMFKRANPPMWTFELFSKHPDSETEVYSGEDAPNVMSFGDLNYNNVHIEQTDFSYSSNYEWHMDLLAQKNKQKA